MIKKITGALSLTLMATTAMAGGLERSNQSVGVIFEDGNYAELSFGTVRPSLTGVSGGTTSSGDMAGDYTQLGFALKMDLTENFGVSIIQDQPYGASVDYSNAGAGYPFLGTTANVDSSSITAIGRYSFGNGFSAYAGVRRTSLDAQVSIPLVASYTLDASKASGTGYLAGVGYEIPEIALRVSLTYNSEIDTTHTATETGAVPGSNPLSVTTPKSLHLEAQSGIAEDTLLFGSVRWVNWSDFVVAPVGYAAATAGDNLLDYSNDSYTYTLGVGRRINENWSASVSARYEAAQGGAGSNLAPNDGSTGISVGARYENDGMSISGGVGYTWLGDTTTDTIGAVFTDNYVIGAGVKIGFHF